MPGVPTCLLGIANLFPQARYAYRSVAQFVKHVTRQTAYLDNFPFPELYKEIAFEESMCDSDSELVKITRAKSKSKSGAPWFHKRHKDRSSKEPIVEKGNADLASSVGKSPAMISSDNTAVSEGVGESDDKEEGTSAIPKARIRESTPHITFSSSPRKTLMLSCSVNAWIFVVEFDLWSLPKKSPPYVFPPARSD